MAPSFRAAMADFQAEGRGSASDDSALGRLIRDFAADWHTAAGFARLLDQLHRDGDPTLPAPPGWTHTSTYWWIDGQDFLGCIRIRHRMIPPVFESAGVIGYDVAPRARRQGHGTAMLRAALPLARRLGFDEVLITCDPDNVGSRKVMIANGGVFEAERHGKLRFWVPTGAGDSAPPRD